MKKILFTGAAGFIGFHLVNKLIAKNKYDIFDLDNINDYNEPRLKFARLNEAGIPEDRIMYGKLIQSIKYHSYQFIRLDLSDKNAISDLFREYKFDGIVNLAAQTRVRYSLINPMLTQKVM